MEMAPIRYFLALCEEKNFTRAAKRIGVSQPTLTNAIKALEEELGGPLFERGRLSSRLTKLGILIQQDLAQIERSATAAKRKAEKFVVCRSPADRHITIRHSVRSSGGQKNPRLQTGCSF
jgi:DNA-binding transcriptional LysR family regulator